MSDNTQTEAAELAAADGLHEAAEISGAAAFADAESAEILNLLSNDAAGGSCCGGSCCS